MNDNERLAELDRRIADAAVQLGDPSATEPPAEPEPPWDPFAELRRTQRAERERLFGEPPPPVLATGNWGAGVGRPSGPVISPDAKMDKLIRESRLRLKYGEPYPDPPGPISPGTRRSP